MSKIRATKEFRVARKNEPIRIQRDDNDYEPVSVPDLMTKVVENYGEHPALAYLDQQTKSWNFISYNLYKQKVDKLAKVSMDVNENA